MYEEIQQAVTDFVLIRDRSFNNLLSDPTCRRTRDDEISEFRSNRRSQSRSAVRFIDEAALVCPVNSTTAESSTDSAVVESAFDEIDRHV